MEKLTIFICICFLFLMQSCTSEQDDISSLESEQENSVSNMVVKYDGQIYETVIVEKGDSAVYLNKEYANLYNSEISKLNNLAAVLSYDDAGTAYLEYFNSEKEIKEQYDFIQSEQKECSTSSSQTRGGVIDTNLPGNTYPIIARAELYDDKNFKDTEAIFYAATAWTSVCDKLKNLGFNDKTSSIKLFNLMEPNKVYRMGYVTNWDPSHEIHWNDHPGNGLRPVLKCYEDSFYSGKVLYCIASPTGMTSHHTDNDLKKIGWNDKISSVSWCIVSNFNVFISQGGNAPEIPEHPDC